MSEETTKSKLAIIRVRGGIRVRNEVEDTLRMLNIHRCNYCTVVPNNASFAGMAKKAKDYITYGEIDDETYKLLVSKKGEKTGDKMKPFFRLNPPKKGFGRKGIKMPFNISGALGYRGSKINDLIKRMI